MICPNCQKEAIAAAATCDDCGYPFTANEEVKAKFIAQQVMKASDIAEAKQSIQTAQYVLFFAGGFTALLAILWSEDMLGLIINLCVAVGFLTFAIILKSNPPLFMSMALVLFLLGYIVQGIDYPETLTQRPIVKAAIAVSLFWGLRMTWIAKKYKKESKYLGRQ